MAERYNGWTNYETWYVALWLDNEEGSYKATRELASECGTVHKLADALKEMHEENMPELKGVYLDMLTAAFSEVDWQEIAEHYLEECDEEDEVEAT